MSDIYAARDLLDKWCDYATLNEVAQEKYYPDLRKKTMEFLYTSIQSTEPHKNFVGVKNEE